MRLLLVLICSALAAQDAREIVRKLGATVLPDFRLMADS
jgi:hypothetical protein